MNTIRDRSAFIPIPSLFHSLEKGGLFEHCLMCDRLLIKPDQNGETPTYFIERIFRGSEPIIEYALCMGCDEIARNELSLDSLRKIDIFFGEHVDLEQRVEAMDARPDREQIESWLEKCVVTKERFEDCHEKQILAVCHGDQLALPTAMMLSGSAIAMVMPLMSKKTREWLGDFTSTNFGMPPEFCDEPDICPVFL